MIAKLEYGQTKHSREGKNDRTAKRPAKVGAIASTKPEDASSGTYGTPRRKQSTRRENAVLSLRKIHPLPVTALGSVLAAYLVDSAERERSMWRLDGLRLTMKNHVLPVFGEATSITAITPERVEKFITASKRKGLKGKSVKNLITDLRACLNWAKSKKLLHENPVDDADLSLIGSTKFVKAPLDLEAIDRAAESMRILATGHGSS